LSRTIPHNTLYPVVQVAPSTHPLSSKFYSVTVPILDIVNEMNPNYKKIVGNAIFEFVQSLVESFAPKVTGMLIDIPAAEIQMYLVNFDHFLQCVSHATQLLQQAADAGQQHREEYAREYLARIAALRNEQEQLLNGSDKIPQAPK
jgi:hypothetical protein